MATETASPGARSDAEARPAASSSRSTSPALLAVGSALALWLCFPPVDRGFLAWVALVPLLTLVRSDRRLPSVYLGSWIGGLTFGLLSCSWVAQADVVGMGFLGLFVSLWWPLFLVATRLGVLRLRLPLMVVAPVVWVALEYLRAHILSGFPWFYLAHTQYAYLQIIQVSDLAGAWGLSLLIALVNCCACDLLSTPLYRPGPGGPKFSKAAIAKVAIALALISSSLLYGMARISSSRFRPGPRLALLQTDFRQELKNHPDFRVIMATLERLVIKAGEQTPRPDLIVWPETSYPVGMVRIDPELPESEFRTQAYRFDPEMTVSDWRDRHDRGMQELPAFAALFDRPMVVGTSSYHFRPGGMDRLNSAIVVRPSAIDAVGYHKQALVPFGEYIPFVETLPWLLKFTPYTDGYIPSLSFGNGPRTLNIDGTRYAPIICFEDTIPHIVLGFFADNRPDVLLNLTNDGWFRGTAEHQAHLAISVFRSVECRTPMARAVNTGISALIDGNGRIRKTMARETSGVLTVEVPLDGRSSLYIRFGDWLPLTCLAITIGLFPLAVVRLLRSPPLAQVNIVG